VQFLGKLLDDISKGKIRIPRFQRPFVWRQSDMLALLQSVMLGYPIGSLFLFNTEEALSSSDQFGPLTIPTPPTATVSYLLDGQQRLSTLAGCLQLPDEASGSRAGDVVWDIYFDLRTGDFVIPPKGATELHHFPVRSLLSTSKFLTASRLLMDDGPDDADDLLTKADDLANAFRNFQIPLVTVQDTDLATAVEVFARLNRRGRRMSADEMVSALTYEDGGFHLADELDTLTEELLEPRGFGNLDRVFMLRAVLATLGRDIYARDWENLVGRKTSGSQPLTTQPDLKSAVDQTAQGLKGALDFLSSVGVTSDRLLPYGLQLVLLAETFRLCPQPDPATRALLERWFWVTSFTGWFRGVNTAQVRKAVDEMRELARGKRQSLEVVDLDAPAEPFPARFDLRSARVRAFVVFLGSLGPRSLGEPNRPLDAGRLLSHRGHHALGHVVSRLGDNELQQSPANRMLVDEGHAGQSIDDLVNDPGWLASHGFDKGFGLPNDDRVGLVRARRSNLVNLERQFMNARKVTPPAVGTVPGVVLADSDVSAGDDGA
jgi:hypothetical protein